MEKIVKLQYPLEYEKDGSKIIVTEIKLIRLKAKHLDKLPPDLQEKKLKGQHASVLLPILSCMAEIPENVLGELDLSDLTVLAQEIESFL